jgi:hypothetical protein
MGDQIDLQEARFGLVPLGEGADRDLLLLGPRRAVILWRNLLEHDPSSLRLQSVSHVFLLSIKQLRSRATDLLPLPHDPLPFVRSIALAYWFGQRSSTPLYPRSSVSISQREKDERDRQRTIFVRQCIPQSGGMDDVAGYPRSLGTGRCLWTGQARRARDTGTRQASRAHWRALESRLRATPVLPSRVDRARVACEVILDAWAQPKAEALPCTLATHETRNTVMRRRRASPH